MNIKHISNKYQTHSKQIRNTYQKHTKNIPNSYQIHTLANTYRVIVLQRGRCPLLRLQPSVDHLLDGDTDRVPETGSNEVLDGAGLGGREQTGPALLGHVAEDCIETESSKHKR